jgi:nicotinate-nucleotide adenylyltransferase
MVISALLNSDLVEEVWLVPSGIRPDKSYYSSTLDRLTLVYALLFESGIPAGRLRVCEAEIQGKVPGVGTANLLRFLRKQYTNKNFFFVIGSDLVMQLPNWLDPDYLRLSVPFLTITRGDYPSLSSDVDSEVKGFNLHSVPQPFVCTISSSELRTLIKNGKVINGYIPKLVAEAIKALGLYR